MPRESLLVLTVGYGYTSDGKLAYTRIFCVNISAETKNYEKFYYADKQIPSTLSNFKIVGEPFFYNMTTDLDYAQIRTVQKLSFGELSPKEANYIHHRKDITRVVENQPLNDIYQVIAPFSLGAYHISGISIVVGFNSYKICHSEAEFKQAISGKILGNVTLEDNKLLLPSNILCYSFLPEQKFSKLIRIASSQDLFALTCSSLGTKPLALSLLAGTSVPQLAIPDAVKYLSITKADIRAISCPEVLYSCVASLKDITNFASPTVCSSFKLDTSGLSGISLPKRLVPLSCFKSTLFNFRASRLHVCLDQCQYYNMHANFITVGDLDPSSRIALADNTNVTCETMTCFELKNTGTASGELALTIYKFKQPEILIKDNFDSLTLCIDNTLYPAEGSVSLTLRIEGCIKCLTLWSNVNSDNVDLIILGSGRVETLVIHKVSHSVGCYIPVGTVDARLPLVNVSNQDISFTLPRVPNFILVKRLDDTLPYRIAYRLSLDRKYRISPQIIAHLGVHSSVPLISLRNKYPIKAAVPVLYLD